VLIDPATGAAPGDRRFLTLSPWLARTGVLRATRLLSINAEGLPEPAAGAVSAFLNRPDHLTRASREVARWDDAVRLGGDASVPKGIVVSEVHVGDENSLALLNDRDAARRVATTITEVVRRVREVR